MACKAAHTGSPVTLEFGAYRIWKAFHVWVRDWRTGFIRRQQAWHKAHNMALMHTFQPSVLSFLSGTAPVRTLTFSQITTHFDRVYNLADFVRIQQQQRTEVAQVLLCTHFVHCAMLERRRAPAMQAFVSVRQVSFAPNSRAVALCCANCPPVCAAHSGRLRPRHCG